MKLLISIVGQMIFKTLKLIIHTNLVLIFTFHVQWGFIEEIYIIDVHRVIVPHPITFLG